MKVIWPYACNMLTGEIKYKIVVYLKYKKITIITKPSLFFVNL